MVGGRREGPAAKLTARSIFAESAGWCVVLVTFWARYLPLPATRCAALVSSGGLSLADRGRDLGRRGYQGRFSDVEEQGFLGAHPLTLACASSGRVALTEVPATPETGTARAHVPRELNSTRHAGSPNARGSEPPLVPEGRNPGLMQTPVHVHRQSVRDEPIQTPEAPFPNGVRVPVSPRF